MAQEDLAPWLTRIKKAGSRAEVFSILDEFRKLEWTDEQCASMGKLYIRVLQRVAKPGTDDDATVAAAATTAQNDGPVWYEKM
jgi:hypothetical protein